jgi:hypothetical protein
VYCCFLKAFLQSSQAVECAACFGVASSFFAAVMSFSIEFLAFLFCFFFSLAAAVSSIGACDSLPFDLVVFVVFLFLSKIP